MLEQNSLGGTNSHVTHTANAAAGQPSLYELTSEDCTLGGINAQASGNAHEFTFEDCSIGGKKGDEKGGGVLKSDTHKSNISQSQPTRHGKKVCNDVHFDSIRDKKGFANAADAMSWQIVIQLLRC